jgi:hypothetical protein
VASMHMLKPALAEVTDEELFADFGIVDDED